jgi:hypothetical protein
MPWEEWNDDGLQHLSHDAKNQEQEHGTSLHNEIPTMNSPHETRASRKLMPYRKASSRDEQYHALEELGRTIVAEYHPSSAWSSSSVSSIDSKNLDLEELARLCIVEIPTTVDVGVSGSDKPEAFMAAAVDRVLNACGVVASISACVACLKELSAATTATARSASRIETFQNMKGASAQEKIVHLETAPQCVQSRVLRICLSTIRRMLCTTSTTGGSIETNPIHQHATEAWFGIPYSYSPAPSSVSIGMDRWVGIVILLLPQLIANACHALHVTLPSWAVPTRLYPRLVESGLFRYDRSGIPSVVENDNPSQVEYISALIRHLVCRRNSDTFVVGLYDYYSSKKRSSASNGHDIDTVSGTPASLLRLSMLLQEILSNVAPRDTATFLRSMLQLQLQLQQRPKYLEIKSSAAGQPAAGVTSEEHHVGDGLPHFLAEMCLPLFDESSHCSASLARKIQDSFLQLIAFSPSSIQPGSSFLADRQLCRLTMKLLSAVRPTKLTRNDSQKQRDDDSSTSSSSDDDDGEDWTAIGDQGNAPSPPPPLRRHVRILLESWSQPTFVQRTDRRLQRHVTLLLRFGLSLLFAPSDHNNDRDNDTRTSPALEPSFHEDNLTVRILEGVTCRLESTLEDIREDGMKVAQLFARHLGQELVFEELKDMGYDSNDEIVSSADTPLPPIGLGPLHQAQHGQQGDSSLSGNYEQKEGTSTTPSTKRKGKMAREIEKKEPKPRVLDPDAEYFSDDSDSDDDDETDEIGGEENSLESNNTDHNDDNSSASCWEGDDDLVPYNLEDDEEDLRETPRPLSLTECLTLLRAVETEETAYSQHEAGLQEVSSLVRSRPADLPDLSVPLAVQLLRMENKFNLPDFSKMRHNALCSLTVEEPMLVGQRLIAELYEDAGLSDRLNVLAALNEAAMELCGDKTLRESRVVKETSQYVMLRWTFLS